MADQKPFKINLREKLGLFSELWSPRIIAEFEGCHFKLAKLKGEFVWHRHPESDEVFLVVQGELQIELRDRVIDLKEGELVVVPRGVEHKPVAKNECHVLLLERAGAINTGDAPPNHLTVGSPKSI